MKTFKDYLQEAERKKAPDEEPKKKTTTQDRPNINLGPDLNAPQDQPLANRPEEPRTPPPETPQAPQQKKSSQADTLRKTSGIHNPRMGDLLSRMRDIEHDDDDWGFPEPEVGTDLTTDVNTENLPSVAGGQLQAAGVSNPDWHKVANLPGNMQRAIRALGKQLFSSMTRTPTNDIWMVANLGGQGPNTSQEVNSVANWLRRQGEDVSTGNIDFDTSIPGYNADIKQYSAGGIRWLMVRDEFGNYIYSWPENDSINANNRAELGHSRPDPLRIGR
jgi:hypothetical protein